MSLRPGPTGPSGPEDSLEEEQRRALRSALEVADLTLDELWMRYFALGGSADLLEVEGHVQGLMPLPPAEVNVLAHALNERLDELFTQRRVPYRPPLRRGRASGPFAALLRLMEEAHAAPPDRLPTLVTEAGTALGVQVTVHVADHEQCRLWPLLPEGATSTGSVPIDLLIRPCLWGRLAAYPPRPAPARACAPFAGRPELADGRLAGVGSGSASTHGASRGWACGPAALAA